MNKQKICIIGGSLTGLVTAISLSKLNCEIDLVMGDNKQIIQSNRTVAISQSNLDFLYKLEISKKFKNDIWPCSIMKLYAENESKNFSELFQLNNKKKEKKILYMIENSKLIKNMTNKVKNIKNINLIKNEKIDKIENAGLLKSVKFGGNNFKYNLIIVCTGANSNFSKNIFPNESIENSYKETSATTILKHDSCKNNVVRQIFLDNAILALLPISKDTILVNANRVKEDQLPDFIKSYKKIWVSDVAERTFYKFPYASKWIGMNVLSINPETIMVDPIQTNLIDQLKKEKFKVIPVGLRHSRTLGGGHHCVTCDLEREC